MTGLIRKDMYCLKKNLILFFGVTIGVIVISVLFIVSARQGNIAKGIAEMKLENNMGEEIFYSFFQEAVWLILFIPVSFLTMIVECFKEDRKAGFFKVVRSMPLSMAKIVGSRYASCALFAAVGLAGSLLTGFFVSLASGTFPLQKLFGFVFCFSAILLIYMSMVMFMLYVFGVEKADLIQCVPFVILLAVAIVAVWVQIAHVPEVNLDTYFIKLMNGISDFMIQKAGVLFLTSLVCMALSFWGSCKILNKRKGNI